MLDIMAVMVNSFPSVLNITLKGRKKAAENTFLQPAPQHSA
jgi:hypothetical protein